MADPPKLLDRVRAAIRARHYSRRTEEAYVGWIKRYIFARHRPQRECIDAGPGALRFGLPLQARARRSVALD